MIAFAQRRSTTLTSTERTRLLLFRQLYQFDFNRQERARLCFVRWLYRTGRVTR
jgi:hypothetical protein